MKYEHLVGRQFMLGTYDCFRMVQDIYKDNFGIIIKNYARPNNWDADRLDIIGPSYAQEGFELVPDWTLKTLRPGDVLAMAVGTSNPNHLAVNLGGNLIIHHKIGALSNTEVLREFWRDSTCYVGRHPDVPDLTPKGETVTLQEILDVRNSF
jgi:cell wall-associated NlpC family hydrolase